MYIYYNFQAVQTSLGIRLLREIVGVFFYALYILFLDSVVILFHYWFIKLLHIGVGEKVATPS